MEKAGRAGEVWQRHTTFMLAATGSAVGLGNIWRFPYVAAEHGGGAFILLYMAVVAVICLPLMLAEVSIGRFGRGSPMSSLETLAGEVGTHLHWRWIGFIGIIAGLLILAFYSVVGGWTASYTFDAILGEARHASASTAISQFEELTSSAWREILWLLLFLLASLAIVAAGIVRGIERCMLFIMPALFLLLIFLVVYALIYGDTAAAFEFMFAWDFSKLGSDAVLAALGQAFFSLSLGMGAMMMYGAYIPQTMPLRRAVLTVCGLDTLVTLLAGLAIFPILFAQGLDPGSGGPSLVFVTMAVAFGNITGGWFLSIVFFGLLMLAALSSAVSLVEPGVSWLAERTRLTRLMSSGVVGLIMLALGVACALSGAVFNFLDMLTANYMLPLGGMAIAIVAGYFGYTVLTEEAGWQPDATAPKIWRGLLRYVVPVAVGSIFLAQLLS